MDTWSVDLFDQTYKKQTEENFECFKAVGRIHTGL